MKKTVSISLAVIVLLGGMVFFGQKLFAVYPPGFEECEAYCWEWGQKQGSWAAYMQCMETHCLIML